MLSDNIKRIRKSKGLSQEELAIKLNVVRQTVSKWENGLSVPDSDMLITLADELDTSVNVLLGETVTEPMTDEALMFLLIWYSVSTTLIQIIRAKIFISDCELFFDTIATFTQTIAGWIILTGKNVAQISDGISNPVVARIIYWLIRILICGGCLVGVGILVAFVGIKTVLPVNLLFLLLLVQVIYVGIRWYVKGWREAREYD